MRIVFALVLLLGIGLAGFAAYMAQTYLSATQAELAAAQRAASRVVETTDVWTARVPLRYGEELKRDHVIAIAWPKRGLPPGAITDIDELFPPSGESRHVLRAMEPGEPMLQVKLTRPGQTPGITAQLSQGMRAFTIQVNVTTGVAGFLRPTDRVDIYWTGRSQQGEITKLIENGMRVIAIDQSADQDRASRAVIARNVTVEATPEQAAALAQAQSTGRLSLSLVGVADDGRVAERIEIDQRRLLGIEAPAPVARIEQPQVCTVRTRRGNEVVEIPIPCTN